MPPPLIVTVAVRSEDVVFSVTFTVIVELLAPEDLLTVHQLLSLDTVHETFEEIVKSLLPLDEEKDKLAGDTSSLLPSCVTETVFVVLLPLTIIVAVRLEVDVFSVTATVIVALLDPEDLLTVHQLLSLLTVHDPL